MFTPLLLALPLFAPTAMAHTLPRHPHAHRAIPVPLAERDNLSERGIPKAHLGFVPPNGELKGIAGFEKRDGMKRVRRRKSKRACVVQQPNVATSLGSNLYANASSSAVYGSTSASTPTASATEAAITSASAVSSSAYEQTPSSVSSAAVAQASNTTESSSGLSGLMAFAFPRGTGKADWTTITDVAGSLSFDSALKPLTAGKLPSAGNAPDGSYALIANYPANTVKLASGQGYSFYSSGDKDGIEITGAKEVVFSYSVWFDEGFEFVKGGKLPGLYGGTTAELAKSCSGGRQDNRDDCFSARLMWRANGAGEIYNYLPSAAYSNPDYCSYPPYSVCDPTYGESIGRGAFTWPTGEWATVAIRLKLNDANVANGEQELFLNGKSVISLTNLMISVNSETKIYGIMAQTFFGGSDSSWASPKDQSAYFKDWSMAVLA